MLTLASNIRNVNNEDQRIQETTVMEGLLSPGEVLCSVGRGAVSDPLVRMNSSNAEC